jgi:anti-sigma regulatory factor (Ser/Thr protein kinase)
VRVEVWDHGHGFKPARQTPDRESMSGWGLYLVDQLADRWGVSATSGTSVWFEIDRAPAPGTDGHGEPPHVMT